MQGGLLAQCLARGERGERRSGSSSARDALDGVLEDLLAIVLTAVLKY